MQAVKTDHNDVRLRLQMNGYRVVAPQAKCSSNGGVYANGRLIIERESKDSMGVVTWIPVNEIGFPNNDTDAEERALYWLLVGAVDDKR